VPEVSEKPAERCNHVFGLDRTEFRRLLSNEGGDVVRFQRRKAEIVSRIRLRQKRSTNSSLLRTDALSKLALLTHAAPVHVKLRLPPRRACFDRARRGVMPCSRIRSNSRTSAPTSNERTRFLRSK
jgi:hypothetical protein